MSKYNFYNVVYRDYSGDIQEEICIAKSKQFVKRTFLEDFAVEELLKIDKISINESYRVKYSTRIEQFINHSKLKKFKIIIFNPENEKIETKTVLAESKREIYTKYREFKVFYISAYTPSFDECCEYYFE